MLKIGIECENLEDPKSRWGVGQMTFNLLKEYSANPEWQKNFKLYLYFKKKVPDDEIFKNTIFVKRVLGFPSFNIFYHILMPLRAMADRLDWMFFPAYMLPPLYLGKSIVMLTDDVYYEYKYGNLPFRYKLAYRLFTNWAAKFATKILAISETSKKNLIKLYNIKPERIFVNYVGVGSRQPTTYNLQPTTFPYILYVGQAFPRRHLKETILAFRNIVQQFPDLKLIAVGKDKYNPPIIDDLVGDINQELESKRIIHYDYIENRDDLEKLYASAKALIYVSDQEAFGLPPMEALSFGVPPVIADNELGRELFGDYAFYVSTSVKAGNIPTFSRILECHNPDEIADGIRRALTDYEKIDKIKNSGPEFAKTYNWKNFANQWLKTIRSLIK